METTNGKSSQDRFLILGGTGFIGRHLVHFLVSNGLASKVRVVDKVPPQMAWLNKIHKEAFDNPLVEYKSANLINPASCASAFSDPEGPYDYVINLAGETKCNQADPVYQEGIVKLTSNTASEAAKQHVKRFVQVSDGHVYPSEKKPSKETSKTNPWTPIARFKLMAEEVLENIENLNYVIIRPAIVYGTGDKTGIVPRVLVGAVYKHLGEMMKLLWTKDLRMNTVHVSDLAGALWHVCSHGPNKEIYNVVDKGDTTQGKIAEIVSDIFNINHDYWGTAASYFAKKDMQSVVDDINDKHMSPWAEACQKDGITNTPLSPYLHQELLYDKHLSLEGGKLDTMTSFMYTVPEINKSTVQEIINDYVQMKLFPQSLTL